MDAARNAKIFIATSRVTADLRADDQPRYPRHGLARQLQHDASRQLARNLLAAAAPDDNDAWIFDAEASGRPFVKRPDGRRGPDISLSHCPDGAACAVVLDGAVGVDIESARLRLDHREIARTYLSVAEQDWVGRCGQPAFLAAWTLREAVAKATGAGMADALTLDGSWIPDAAHGTYRLALADASWVIGHRACGGTHVAIAWRLSDTAADRTCEAAAALDRAAATLQ